MYKQKDYIIALFEPDEKVCVGRTVKDTELVSVETFSDHYYKESYIVINPLVYSRKDENVTCYRNILVEFDDLSLYEQKQLMDKFPYTTCVYSGGKSLHFIISLQNPCKSKQEYDKLVRRIYNKLPQCDKSAKNPSRFTRLAQGIRNDNNREQTLDYVGSRVSNEELLAWLGPEPEEKYNPPVFDNKVNEVKILSSFVQYVLRNGVLPGERNSTAFKVACELARGGHSQDEAIDLIYSSIDLEISEITNVVKSAFKAVRSSGHE